jgi:hypothetical protein
MKTTRLSFTARIGGYELDHAVNLLQDAYECLKANLSCEYGELLNCLHLHADVDGEIFDFGKQCKSLVRWTKRDGTLLMPISMELSRYGGKSASETRALIAEDLRTLAEKAEVRLKKDNLIDSNSPLGAEFRKAIDSFEKVSV